MDKEVTCPDCNTTSEQSELLLKLGGVLCPHCRCIIYPPHDPEYKLLQWDRQEDDDEDATEA